jgi:hypothetical protein
MLDAVLRTAQEKVAGAVTGTVNAKVVPLVDCSSSRLLSLGLARFDAILQTCFH